MVLGFFEGSMVTFALRNISPPAVTVISSLLQTRFICLRISSGIGWPSAVPETMDHSPRNWSMSFLMAGLSSAAASEIAAQESPSRNVFRMVFIGVFGWLEWDRREPRMNPNGIPAQSPRLRSYLG